MGRNWIPKLSEWRDGKCYRFRTVKPDGVRPDSGELIIFECENSDHTVETLATCWADGFQECMAMMFLCGQRRGEYIGSQKKLAEIKEVLEIE